MNGDWPHIAEWRIVEMERDYWPLNVRQELVKMQNWIIANPKRRKKNYNRFIINWLNRAHASVVVSQANNRVNALVGSHSRTPSKEQLEQYERNEANGYRW